MTNTFTKDMLKTGMILKYDNGDLGMVLLGTANGDIVSGENWGELELLSNSMNGGRLYMDVTAVYQPTSNKQYYGSSVATLSIVGCDLLWERKSSEDKATRLEKVELQQQLSEAQEAIEKVKQQLANM
jgi:hypothetical protein